MKAIVYYDRNEMSLEDIRRILAEFHSHALSTKLLEITQLELERQIAKLQETYRYLIAKIKIHRHLAALENQGLSDSERRDAYYDIRQKEKFSQC